MPVFSTSEEFYACVGELLIRAGRDPQIGQKIAASGLIIQFRYTDPDAVTTVDAKHKPSRDGQFVEVVNGPCDLKPDIVMSMNADVSHAFWHGKVNLLSALSKKEIVAQGPIPKILKLLPAVQPLYTRYPELLRELGKEHLIIQ